MERLTKRQKEILECLDYAYPRTAIPEEELLIELDEHIDISMELKILEEKGLVKLYRTRDIRRGRFDKLYLQITPKGMEKLRENFITRLQDAVYDNPLKAISIGIAFISVILGLITIWK